MPSIARIGNDFCVPKLDRGIYFPLRTRAAKESRFISNLQHCFAKRAVLKALRSFFDPTTNFYIKSSSYQSHLPGILKHYIAYEGIAWATAFRRTSLPNLYSHSSFHLLPFFPNSILNHLENYFIRFSYRCRKRKIFLMLFNSLEVQLQKKRIQQISTKHSYWRRPPIFSKLFFSPKQVQRS